MSAHELLAAFKTVDYKSAIDDATTKFASIQRKVDSHRGVTRGDIANLRIWVETNPTNGSCFDALHQKCNIADKIVKTALSRDPAAISRLRESVYEQGCLVEGYSGISEQRIRKNPQNSGDGSGWLLIGAGVPKESDNTKTTLLGAVHVFIPPDDHDQARGCHQMPDPQHLCPQAHSRTVLSVMEKEPACVTRNEDLSVHPASRRRHVATAMLKAVVDEIYKINNCRKYPLRAEYGAIADLRGIGYENGNNRRSIGAEFNPSITNIPSAGILTKDDSGCMIGWQSDQWIPVDVEGGIANRIILNWLLIGRLLKEETPTDTEGMA